jgi:hypothetical protein
MKRALLIAGGTVGGLGAVLAITPPQFTSTQDVNGLAGSLGGGTGATQPQTAASATQAAPTPAATKAVATKAAATKSAKAPTKQSAVATQSATSTPSSTPTKSATAAAPTPTPTPTATKTTAAPSSGGYSGTVTGASFNARNYGTLSATVTFSNGQISHVSASQSPSSWSQQSLSALIPYVSGGKITVEQIKSYAAEQLPCAISNSCRSQASFTATAFWQSVKSAISKAGL